MEKKFYVKHEGEYFVREKTTGLGRMVEWTNLPERATAFPTFEAAKSVAEAQKKGPRQFAGLGSKARVVSRK